MAIGTYGHAENGLLRLNYFSFDHFDGGLDRTEQAEEGVDKDGFWGLHSFWCGTCNIAKYNLSRQITIDRMERRW